MTKRKDTAEHGFVWRWNIQWKEFTSSGEPWHVWGFGLNLDNFKGFHIMLGKAVVSFGWVRRARALQASKGVKRG